MRSKLEALSLSFAVFFSILAACAYLTPTEIDVSIKIVARRLGNYGVKNCPVPFIELGQIAQNACDRPEETLTAAAALEMIIEVITLRLDDPLLAADLKDLLSLLKVRLDASLKLVGLTPELERLIKVAVCAFAQGVKLKPAPG